MPREPRPPGEKQRPPETAAEAVARARMHARRAVGEALAAARALLDAASIGSTGRPGEAHPALRGITELLDAQSARLAGDEGSLPPAVLSAILEALDHEIARWEREATTDPNARAVLRTFLGLREILWEFGLRREDDPGSAAKSPTPPRRKATRKGRGKPGSGPRRPGRVQRVDVRG